MMSPLADIVQLPHIAPVMHAQVGVLPHPDGSGWQAKAPGLVTAPPSIASQYCVPFAQNRGPQANVPVGGVHPPTPEMSWPAALASQALL